MEKFASWICDETNEVYEGRRPYAQKANLESGYYDLSQDYYTKAPILKKIPLKNDKLCSFSTGPLSSIIREVEKFWKCDNKYLELGMTHKRSIMLYGPPGCGKTGIIQSVIDAVIARNGVAFRLNNVEMFIKVFPKFREIEPKTPIVAIIEDIENQLSIYEIQFLELLDGSSSVGGNVLYLSTTNNLEEIPERIRCRPSRVDTLIEVGRPSKEQRLEYIKFVLENVPCTKDDYINSILELTDDFTLADVKEIIISTYVYEKTVNEAVDRVRSAKEPLVDPTKDKDDDSEDDDE